MFDCDIYAYVWISIRIEGIRAVAGVFDSRPILAFVSLSCDAYTYGACADQIYYANCGKQNSPLILMYLTEV